VTVLAVDLAAKFSAFCVMPSSGEVLHEEDSFGRSEEAFLDAITANYETNNAEVLVVEDLPHGLSYTKTVKAVCRLQGRIVQQFYDGGSWQPILFVAPAAWRAHYDGMQRGTGPEAVFDASTVLGYYPPDITARAKGNGGPSRARKVASDYCSAFLIARWALDMKAKYGTYDVPGTSRYDTAVILKKDFKASAENG
jgi:hypothetical protein